METASIFKEFVKDIQTAFPDVTFNVTENIEEAVEHIQTNFFPHILKIIKRDVSFWTEPRILLGINLSQLWDKPETHDLIWKHMLLCMTASLLHGDIKTKFSQILGIIKTVWNGSNPQNEEITNILNNENSENRLKEIFEYFMETRIYKVFLEIMESFDVSDLENIDPLEILQNPEHPAIQKTINKIKNIVTEKIKHGSLSQEQLQREVETIKAKVISVFGNMVFGGETNTTPSAVLLSNSPEARRQRMLARLQKKHRDKK